MVLLRRGFKTAVVVVFAGLVGWHCQAAAAQESMRIVCTTFPVFHITRNIVNGQDAVQVSLMIPADLGCPHDYALTPQDIQMLTQADVLVINGLGMEAFLDALLKHVGPRVKLIDSSQGIAPTLHLSEDEANHVGHERPAGKENHDEAGAGHGDHNAGHRHAGLNPHLFASPRMAALIAMSIASQLTVIDAAHGRLYQTNSQAYAATMNRLADDSAALGRRLRNNRIVTQHGVFDYLARDMGLKVVAVIQAHAGQEPAASEIMAIVQTARREKAGAVFTEPQYPDKIGRTIAREAGIAAAFLDPVAGGPLKAPIDYYETVMRVNLDTMEKVLGTR